VSCFVFSPDTADVDRHCTTTVEESCGPEGPQLLQAGGADITPDEKPIETCLQLIHRSPSVSSSTDLLVSASQPGTGVDEAMTFLLQRALSAWECWKSSLVCFQLHTPCASEGQAQAHRGVPPPVFLNFWQLRKLTTVCLTCLSAAQGLQRETFCLLSSSPLQYTANCRSSLITVPSLVSSQMRVIGRTDGLVPAEPYLDQRRKDQRVVDFYRHTLRLKQANIEGKDIGLVDVSGSYLFKISWQQDTEQTTLM